MKISRFICQIFSLISLALCLPENVVVCSQNLMNFGSERGPLMRDLRATLLSERIAKPNCDIVAVQEITAKRFDHARNICKTLTDKLREVTFQGWECILGDTEEGPHRLAFVWKSRNIDLIDSYSYKNVEIPRLSKIDKVTTFQRVPLEATFRLKFKNGSRTISLVNIHLKSKAGGQNDPTGFKWEIMRMEQAEAVRRLVVERLLNKPTKHPVLILGDRNSDFDSPTAKILEGSLILKDFADKAPCRIAKHLVPVCMKDVPRPPVFVSVVTKDPALKAVGGTFKHGKRLQFLDDILIDTNHLVLVQKRRYSTREFNSGILFEPKEASDHALVWTRLEF